jgi:hypothetical protein
MFLLVEENVMNGIPGFAGGFQDMQMVAFHLNPAFVQSPCESDRKGTHGSGKDRVVLCRNNQVNVIGLKRIVLDLQAVRPRIGDGLFQESQGVLIPDLLAVPEVDVKGSVLRHFFADPMGHPFGTFPFSTCAGSESSPVSAI